MTKAMTNTKPQTKTSKTKTNTPKTKTSVKKTTQHQSRTSEKVAASPMEEDGCDEREEYEDSDAETVFEMETSDIADITCTEEPEISLLIQNILFGPKYSWNRPKEIKLYIDNVTQNGDIIYTDYYESDLGQMLIDSEVSIPLLEELQKMWNGDETFNPGFRRFPKSNSLVLFPRVARQCALFNKGCGLDIDDCNIRILAQFFGEQYPVFIERSENRDKIYEETMKHYNYDKNKCKRFWISLIYGKTLDNNFKHLPIIDKFSEAANDVATHYAEKYPELLKFIEENKPNPDSKSRFTLLSYVLQYFERKGIDEVIKYIKMNNITFQGILHDGLLGVNCSKKDAETFALNITEHIKNSTNWKNFSLSVDKEVDFPDFMGIKSPYTICDWEPQFASYSYRMNNTKSDTYTYFCEKSKKI